MFDDDKLLVLLNMVETTEITGLDTSLYSTTSFLYSQLLQLMNDRHYLLGAKERVEENNTKTKQKFKVKVKKKNQANPVTQTCKDLFYIDLL